MRFTCLSVMLFAFGCSAFRPVNDRISINCGQPDTLLMVNGQRMDCPSSVEVQRNRMVTVQAYKSGYAGFSQNIDHHFSTTGILDVVGCLVWILPGIGIFTPGAWDLDQNTVNINLYRQ